MAKSKSEFTVMNLASIGELEDAYALYENSVALYSDAVQAYRAAHPNGIPDMDHICRKEFRELVNNYYNAHLYLFTSEYRNQHTCQDECSLSLCSERALKSLTFLEATFTN